MKNTKQLTIILAITLAIYAPVLYGLRDAFIDDKGFLTIDYIVGTLSKPHIINSLKFTFSQALLSALIASTIGSLAAFSLLFIGTRGARLLRSISIVSFMAPPMVVVTGFTALFGNNGLLSTVIPFLKILGEGFWAIIAAHVFYNIPLAINFVYASLVSMPKEIIDSINMFGFGKIGYVARKIIVPYILPAYLSAFTLSFIYCFTSFAIPLSLGGVEYSTLEVYIYYYYKILFNPHGAASIAFIQYMILSTIVFLFIVYHGRTYAAPVGYRHYRFIIKNRFYRILLNIFIVLVFLYLVTPLTAISYHAFYNPYTKSFSLSGFHRVLDPSYDPGLGVGTGLVYVNTFYYAFMTAVFSITLSSIIVILGNKYIDFLYASLLAVSPLTMSLGLMRLYGSLVPNQILIVLAHVIAALPLTTRIIRVGFERVGRKYIEAAYMLKEKGLPLYLRVVFPLMKPAYLVAISLALVVSLGEFSATYFISTTQTITLGIAIYRYRGLRDWQASASAALLLLILTTTILLSLSRKIERWL